MFESSRFFLDFEQGNVTCDYLGKNLAINELGELDEVVLFKGPVRASANFIFMNPKFRMLSIEELIEQRNRAIDLDNSEIIDFWWGQDLISETGCLFYPDANIFRRSDFTKYRMLNESLRVDSNGCLVFDEKFLDLKGSSSKNLDVKANNYRLGDLIEFDFNFLTENSILQRAFSKRAVLDSNIHSVLFGGNLELLGNYWDRVSQKMRSLSECCSCNEYLLKVLVDNPKLSFNNLETDFYREKLWTLGKERERYGFYLSSMNQSATLVAVPNYFK